MKRMRLVGEQELVGGNALRLAQRMSTYPFDTIDTLVLSLRNTQEIDASGLAILVRLYSQLLQAGKRLVLEDVPQHLTSLFEQLEIADVLMPSQSEGLPILSIGPEQQVAE